MHYRPIPALKMKMKKRIVMIAIIVSVLLLSMAAGLLTARADSAYRSYLPLIAPPQRSKLGIAPGGYQPGDLDRLGAAWAYRWNNEWFTDTAPIWVDMIWGERYMDVPIKSDVILGFNEPDLSGQADMTPTLAAQLWREIETRYPDKLLISPAPSQLRTDWLWQMVDEYQRLYGTRPRFDGVAVHYYRYSESMPLASEYVRQFRATEVLHGWDVPLWLTEVGACGVDEVAMLRDVAQAASEYDYLARAAWYKLRSDVYDPSSCSVLISDDNQLTALGEMYLTFSGGLR